MFQLSLSALCLALLMQCTVAQEQATEHICKRDGTQITGDTSSVQGSFSNAVDTCQASPACTGLTYVPGEGYHLKSGTFVEIVDLLSGIASYLRVCLEDYARQQQVESSTPGVNSLAFDPSNRLWIAAGTATGSVKTWFRTRQKSEATRHVGAVQSVQFSPAGNGVLASAGDDMNVHLTDRSSGALVGTLPCVDSSGAPRVRSPIHALAYSPDGASIAAGCADGSIWQFNTAGTCELIGLGGGGEDLSAKLRVQGGGPYYYGPPVTALAYMPRGGGLIVGVGTEVEVWDVAAKLRRMSGWHGGSITAVAWSDNAEWIASGSADGKIKLWKLSPWTGPAGAFTHRCSTCYPWQLPLQHTLRKHRAAVTSLDFAADSTRLLSGSEDHTVRAWDLRSAEQVAMQDTGAPVYTVQWDGSSGISASVGPNGTACHSQCLQIMYPPQPTPTCGLPTDDIFKWCPELDPTGCTVLTMGWSGRSCSEFCGARGKRCAGAWQAVRGQCVTVAKWTCSQTETAEGSTTDQLLCQCEETDCELGPGRVEYIACPYESILMEYCYKCFRPPSEEVLVCDGWSEEEVRAQCSSPLPLRSPLLPGLPVLPVAP